MTLEELRRHTPTQLCPWCFAPHVSGVKKRRRCAGCLGRATPPLVETRAAFRICGVCTVCRETRAVPGRALCRLCADVASIKQAHTRATREAAGLCVRCGCEPPIEGKRGCVRCVMGGVA